MRTARRRKSKQCGAPPLSWPRHSSPQMRRGAHVLPLGTRSPDSTTLSGRDAGPGCRREGRRGGQMKFSFLFALDEVALFVVKPPGPGKPSHGPVPPFPVRKTTRPTPFHPSRYSGSRGDTHTRLHSPLPPSLLRFAESRTHAEGPLLFVSEEGVQQARARWSGALLGLPVLPLPPSQLLR